MEKNKLATFALLTLAFSATLLVTLLLPAAYAWYDDGPLSHEWPHDDYCRCDHTSVEGTEGYPDDTWTATAIHANYRESPHDPPYYISGTWYFERGYGGGGTPHDYTVRDNYYFCTYVHDVYSTTFYDYGSPSYVANGGFWQNNSAYYQDYNNRNGLTLNSFDPSLASNLQSISATYFEDPNNPSNQWYVSSYVSITAQH